MANTSKPKAYKLPLSDDGEVLALYPFGAQCAPINQEQLESPAFIAWLEEFRPEIFKQLESK